MAFTTNIIALIVVLALAAIPAVIASKKYYSAVGFYIYGVLAFLPALIHVICLPDQSKSYARRTSAGVIVLGAFTGIVSMYSVLTSFAMMISDIEFRGFSGVAIIWILCELLQIAISIWLMVCVFRCDRNRGIMLNFIFSAVAEIVIELLSTVSVVIQIKGIDNAPPLWAILARSWKYMLESAVLCMAYLVFALFVYRLNAGKSVMPKALYCLVPGIAVAVISMFILVSASDYANMTTIANSTLNFFKFFLVGGYLWAASNIPSDPVAPEGTYMGMQQ